MQLEHKVTIYRIEDEQLRRFGFPFNAAIFFVSVESCDLGRFIKLRCLGDCSIGAHGQWCVDSIR